MRRPVLGILFPGSGTNEVISHILPQHMYFECYQLPIVILVHEHFGLSSYVHVQKTAYVILIASTRYDLNMQNCKIPSV